MQIGVPNWSCLSQVGYVFWLELEAAWKLMGTPWKLKARQAAFNILACLGLGFQGVPISLQAAKHELPPDPLWKPMGGDRAFVTTGLPGH